ncbi:hypothetical protein QQ045_002775 [Rhodiola kirilowii]
MPNNMRLKPNPRRADQNSSNPRPTRRCGNSQTFRGFGFPGHRVCTEVFDDMTERNCFSYNTMIRALVEEGEAFEAVVVFGRMREEGVVEPNRFTFPSVLKGCAEGGMVGVGRQVHVLVLKMGVMEDACKVFDKSKEGGREVRALDGSVVLWNVMVGGYVRVGEFEAARELFDRMPERSVVS